VIERNRSGCLEGPELWKERQSCGS